MQRSTNVPAGAHTIEHNGRIYWLEQVRPMPTQSVAVVDAESDTLMGHFFPNVHQNGDGVVGHKAVTPDDAEQDRIVGEIADKFRSGV